MGDVSHIRRGVKGSAVKDVQARLASLGYDLGSEAQQGVFGAETAQAVAAFRDHARLAPGDEVDRDTWTALVDATFTFGDRLLYLRMPYFHGRDVRTLQTALSALGFSCTADGIFGGYTERAVREFQQNAGIGSDGIVGDTTFSAIDRLRHAWEGKRQLASEVRPLGFARAAEVLERTPLCIVGEDDAARGVAERISNLAMATTTASLVVSASSLEQVPDTPALIIQLTSVPALAASASASAPAAAPAPTSPAPATAAPLSGSTPVGRARAPRVIYDGEDGDATINARMATAIRLVSGKRPRITVLLTKVAAEGERLSPHEEQHIAVALLDALCLAFS